MAENTKKTEGIEDFSQEVLSPEELKKRKHDLQNMFKQQTLFLKSQAEYEEMMTRIAVAQRDRAVAEYELARIMAEQKRAEEEFNKQNSAKEEEKKEN